MYVVQTLEIIFLIENKSYYLRIYNNVGPNRFFFTETYKLKYFHLLYNHINMLHGKICQKLRANRVDPNKTT